MSVKKNDTTQEPVNNLAKFQVVAGEELKDVDGGKHHDHHRTNIRERYGRMGRFGSQLPTPDINLLRPNRR